MRRTSQIAGEIFVGLDLFVIGVAMIAMTWIAQRELQFAEWTTSTLLANVACWLTGVFVAARGIATIRAALRRPSPVPGARAERRG